MTRINCGIPPKKLTTKHLIAEHREICRIPNTVKNGKAKIQGIPPLFTLGTGHVKFFYDKILFLKKRYEEIYQECIERGFKVTYYGQSFEGIDIRLMNDYSPTERDVRIVEDRIKDRLGIN